MLRLSNENQDTPMTLPKRHNRHITVDSEVYRWYLKGNEITKGWKHIAIQHSTISGQLLLLDPFPWQVEIRPQTIRDVIVFALEHGWSPKSAEKPLYIGHDGESFIVLPKNRQYTIR